MPSASSTAWTNVTDGTRCGDGQVCREGLCTADCYIDGTFQRANTPNSTNPCQACLPATSTTGWSNLTDGTSCDSANFCASGTCSAGCFVNGGFYAAGAANPLNVCQVCVPAASSADWSDLAGTSCGPGEICNASTCSAGCYVDATYYTPNAAAPNNPCQTCQPSAATATFTLLPDSTTCGNGQVCVGGSCGTQCDIDGTTYASGALNPANACGVCQPGTSTSSFSALADGTTCGAGDICVSGQCAAQCDIGETVYAASAGNPVNVCQSCQPAASTSSWSNVSDGSACTTGGTCVGGNCTCNTGLTLCDGLCVDTTSDVNNCGSCGDTCNAFSGGVCSDSLCGYVFASGLEDAVGVASDGANVYWVDQLRGEVLACPVSGCAGAPSVLASGLSEPRSIATDGTNVYFADVLLPAGGFTIAACPVGGCGGTPTILATEPVVNTTLVTDGTNVYWGGDNGSDDESIIVACAVGGCAGTPRTVVDASAAQGPATAVTSDGVNVYWKDSELGEIFSCAATGCSNATPMATGQGRVAGENLADIATDGTNVYWANEGLDTIMACPVDGCGVGPTVIASGRNLPTAITTDGLNVYWVEAREAIFTCPVAGCLGAPTMLAKSPLVIGSPVVAGSKLYWSLGTSIQFVSK